MQIGSEKMPETPYSSACADVDAAVEGTGSKKAAKLPKLSDFLDGHMYPEAKELLTVLDMYAGCGGMSTGLGHGLGKAAVHLEPVSPYLLFLTKQMIKSLLGLPNQKMLLYS